MSTLSDELTEELKACKLAVTEDGGVINTVAAGTGILKQKDPGSLEYETEKSWHGQSTFWTKWKFVKQKATTKVKSTVPNFVEVKQQFSPHLSCVTFQEIQDALN